MKHLIVGTVLIAFGLWGMSTWWESFGLVMRALVPFSLLVVGILAVLSSYYRLGRVGVEDEPDLRDDEVVEE
jgi:hypothetical protein